MSSQASGSGSLHRRWALPSPSADFDAGFEHVPPALGTAAAAPSAPPREAILEEEEEATFESDTVRLVSGGGDVNQSMDSLIDGDYTRADASSAENVQFPLSRYNPDGTNVPFTSTYTCSWTALARH